MGPAKVSILCLAWVLLCLLYTCNGLGGLTKKCSELTDGYNLTEDYDSKVPPSAYTKVSLVSHIFDISEVDDFKQTVTILFTTSYGWKETRINFEKDSIYGKSLRGAELNPDFVKNCLWHPGLIYLFTDETQPEKTYQLVPNGVIVAKMQGRITINCYMDFKHYPFDKQVCYMQLVPQNPLNYFKVQ